jgi:TolB protein
VKVLQIAFMSLALVVSPVLQSKGLPSSKPANGSYTIAFASFSPLNTDIFIARGDGGAPRPLLANPWPEYNASLSVDGKWVTFTSERAGSADIYRMHPNGSGLQRLVSGPAFDDQGVLSPDGSKLAFVSDRSGQADVWVLDLKSRALTNISNHPAGDFRPAWSPDGQWLAFSSDRDSPNEKTVFVTLHSAAIYLVRANGKDLRRLSEAGAFAGSPSWSADGRTVSFYECDLANVGKITAARRLRGTTQIATINIETGEHRVLTEGAGEKWSPHWLPGGQIGYASGGPEGGLEFLAGAAGPRGEVRSPSWSADGRTMVFHRDAGGEWPPFQRWHSLDAAFHLVRTGVFPAYLPSGTHIVLNDKTAGILRNDIIAINADGSGRTTLFHDEQRSALAPVVSPNGKQIAFGLGDFFQAVKGKARADIAVINADGSGLELLTDGTGNYGLPSWSPDGREIVYRADGGGKDGLYIMDVASRVTRHLAETSKHDNFPSWSPKGDRISFTSYRDGDYEIYSVRPDGSDMTRLTNRPGNDAHGKWSPDGEWIAFTSAGNGFKDEAALHPNNPQPYGDLYVMRADGSDARRLTDNQFEEGTPNWAPAPAPRARTGR